MNVVDINLKLIDALINAQIAAQNMAERNDFSEKYHNGRADAFVEAQNIVERVLLQELDFKEGEADDIKSKSDLNVQRKKAAEIILNLKSQNFDNNYIAKKINDEYPELKVTARDIFALEKAHLL